MGAHGVGRRQRSCIGFSCSVARVPVCHCNDCFVVDIHAVPTLLCRPHSKTARRLRRALPGKDNSSVEAGSNLSYAHYNFASPRVGDTGFAQAMNSNPAIPTFRVVNTEDIVPDAPLPLMGSTVYQHIGTPVDFTAEYLTTDGNHSMADCYWYAINNVTQPQGPLSSATLMQQVRFDGVVASFRPQS